MGLLVKKLATQSTRSVTLRVRGITRKVVSVLRTSSSLTILAFQRKNACYATKRGTSKVIRGSQMLARDALVVKRLSIAREPSARQWTPSAKRTWHLWLLMGHEKTVALNTFAFQSQ